MAYYTRLKDYERYKISKTRVIAYCLWCNKEIPKGEYRIHCKNGGRSSMHRTCFESKRPDLIKFYKWPEDNDAQG